MLALGFIIARLLDADNATMPAAAADEDVGRDKMDVDVSSDVLMDPALKSLVSTAVSQLGTYIIFF